MIIGIDFDNTIVTNSYPKIGADLGAIPWLIEAQGMGARFILFTMRDGEQLAEAADYLISRGVKLFGVNINPSQWEWTMSPKPYCHMYIDDRNMGVWLENGNVDWGWAGPRLIDEVRAWRPSKDLIDGKRFVGGTK